MYIGRQTNTSVHNDSSIRSPEHIAGEFPGLSDRTLHVGHYVKCCTHHELYTCCDLSRMHNCPGTVGLYLYCSSMVYHQLLTMLSTTSVLLVDRPTTSTHHVHALPISVDHNTDEHLHYNRELNVCCSPGIPSHDPT